MLLISHTQTETFAVAAERSFVGRSILFLQTNFADWSAKRTENELHAYVERMIDLCSRFQIRAEINIQKMTALHVRHDYAIPPTGMLRSLLTLRGFSEEERIDRFADALVNGRATTRIWLDSDMEKIRAGHG